MSTRLATTGPFRGRLVDTSKPVKFTFNGQHLRGYAGDTLASALLANDQMLMGRSFKYHRPRGVVASGAEEPNALVTTGVEGRMEPNQRVTTTELFEGLAATSQNHWPSLEFDLGAINKHLSRFLPAGFYYKMFMYPRAFWKHLYEPVIRQSAGLGPAPKARDEDTYEHYYAFCDVLVIGGGVAGLQAALTAGKSGARVILMEQTDHWGGRGVVDGGTVDGAPVDKFVEDTLAQLGAMDNVELRTRLMGAGVYDHGYALGYERLTDHAPAKSGPRHRLWRVRAAQIITATGAIERPLSFAGNDIPGVMLASAVRDYVVNYGVSVGDRTIVVTNNDNAYLTAITLKKAGLDVPAILDARVLPEDRGLVAEAKALGIRVMMGHAISSVKGGKRVTGVEVCSQAGEGAVLEEIACDAVAMSGGWSPVVHLWSHCGGKLRWDTTQNCFSPDVDNPPKGADGMGFVTPAGAASGMFALDDVLHDAHAAAEGVITCLDMKLPKDTVSPVAERREESPMMPVWMMPHGAKTKLREKMWLDYQNDVKVSDVQLAAQEGFVSVEHAKRYTTLGMATDQGKLSNINGLATLAGALDAEIPSVGTTTFRPPYHPISLASIAGEAKNHVFQPIRRTPMHDWHAANGAEFEPVGQWRRPYAFKRGNESTHDCTPT